MARSLLFFASLLLALAGVARAQVDGGGVYRIQPGDALSVSVLEDPGLNQSVLVRPDGRISLPLVGALVVEGLSPEQARDLIRDRLARDFVTPPTVNVALQSAVEQTDTVKVYVLGQVGSGGLYEVETPIDLLQLLAIAGGPGPFAATERIQLRSNVDGREEVRFFNYALVEDGATPIERIPVREGDVIVVPERGLFE